MAIETVGVIGCGLMGGGIAQVTAQAGFPTIVVEANDELLKRGLGRLRQALDGSVERAKIDAKLRDEAVARLTGSTRLEDLKPVIWWWKRSPRIRRSRTRRSESSTGSVRPRRSLPPTPPRAT